MNTKHKHYEFIVAFAEGKGVEYTEANQWPARWRCVESVSLFEQCDVKFRLKPEQKKTAGYRRYIQFDPYNTTYHVKCVSTTDMHDPSLMRNFCRWVDPDWCYETVEGV